MGNDRSDSGGPFAGVGGATVVGGVVCCVGLKLLGGAALFGGLAATLGLSTDVTTFVVGSVAGLLLAVAAVHYRRPEGASRAGE